MSSRFDPCRPTMRCPLALTQCALEGALEGALDERRDAVVTLLEGRRARMPHSQTKMQLAGSPQRNSWGKSVLRWQVGLATGVREVNLTGGQSANLNGRKSKVPSCPNVSSGETETNPGPVLVGRALGLFQLGNRTTMTLSTIPDVG